MFHAVGDQPSTMCWPHSNQSGGEAWQRLRPRIEHGDMLEPAHFERAKRLGVTLVQNPSHFMLPALMAPRLGPRTARLDDNEKHHRGGCAGGARVGRAAQSLLERDVRVDQRDQPRSGDDPRAGGQRLHARLGAGELMETQKGTLSPGMLADMAILSQDIFTAPPEALPGTVSVLTLVGGRVVHEQK